jgi:hypothetical protein
MPAVPGDWRASVVSPPPPAPQNPRSPARTGTTAPGGEPLVPSAQINGLQAFIRFDKGFISPPVPIRPIGSTGPSGGAQTARLTSRMPPFSPPGAAERDRRPAASAVSPPSAPRPGPALIVSTPPAHGPPGIIQPAPNLRMCPLIRALIVCGSTNSRAQWLTCRRIRTPTDSGAPASRPPIPARSVATALALSRSNPRPPREHRAPWARQRPHGSPAAARLRCLRATPGPESAFRIRHPQ